MRSARVSARRAASTVLWPLIPAFAVTREKAGVQGRAARQPAPWPLDAGCQPGDGRSMWRVAGARPVARESRGPGASGKALAPRSLPYPASQVSYQEVVAQRGLLATFCTDLFATEMKLKLTRLMIGSSFIASSWNCR